MAGVESVITPQPVIKDVQTLKANLKEQEKRARSAEVEEVLPPNSVVPPTPSAEQRKRRKVSNATQDIEEPVLDGPLPLNTEEESSDPVEQPISSSIEPAPSSHKAEDSHTTVSDTPAKVNEPIHPVSDASATVAVEESKEKPSASTVVPPSSEITTEPVGSKDGTKISDENSESAVQEPSIDIPNGHEIEAAALNGTHEELAKS